MTAEFEAGNHSLDSKSKKVMRYCFFYSSPRFEQSCAVQTRVVGGESQMRGYHFDFGVVYLGLWIVM